MTFMGFLVLAALLGATLVAVGVILGASIAKHEQRRLRL